MVSVMDNVIFNEQSYCNLIVYNLVTNDFKQKYKKFLKQRYTKKEKEFYFPEIDDVLKNKSAEQLIPTLFETLQHPRYKFNEYFLFHQMLTDGQIIVNIIRNNQFLLNGFCFNLSLLSSEEQQTIKENDLSKGVELACEYICDNLMSLYKIKKF